MLITYAIIVGKKSPQSIRLIVRAVYQDSDIFGHDVQKVLIRHLTRFIVSWVLCTLAGLAWLVPGFRFPFMKAVLVAELTPGLVQLLRIDRDDFHPFTGQQFEELSAVFVRPMANQKNQIHSLFGQVQRDRSPQRPFDRADHCVQREGQRESLMMRPVTCV